MKNTQRKEKMIGQRFNSGKVVRQAGKDKYGSLLWELLCDCGNKYNATTSALTVQDRKSCGCTKLGKNSKKSKNNIGVKYGMLTVIDIDGTRNPSNSLYRKCLCDCGREKYVTQSYLTGHKNPSCGCIVNKPKGKDSSCYTGYEEITGKYWCAIRLGAKKRGIEFNISTKDAWDLFIRQNRKCSLSGLDIKFDCQSCRKLDQTASLDRIDSSVGYMLNNIQWVHKDVNLMKNKFSQKRFLEVCMLVSRTVE